MSNNICVIGVYFGAFPKYFDIWLKSAGTNKKIDFILFTDNTKDDLPDNVKLINMTLPEMKALAELKLGMKISLERPYKCCDFKVVYGIIFEDYIKNYEYWGHCDFDLVWGDIYSFIEKYDYQKYDRFLNLGHFSIYKNTDIVNSHYKDSGSLCGNYIEVFTDNESHAFDELTGINKIYEKHGYPVFNKRIFADISTFYKRYRATLLDNYDSQIFYWENGHIYRAYIESDQVYQDEYIYIHFHKRPHFDLPEGYDTAKRIYITNKGFVPSNDEAITKELIQKLNPYHGELYEKLELARYNVIDIFRRATRKFKRLLK